MADTVCVLRALVYGELAVLPLCERRQQLARVVVPGGRREALVCSYRRLSDRLVGVAGNTLGMQRLRGRIRLIEGFSSGRIEQQTVRFQRIRCLDQLASLDCRFEPVG